MKRVSSFLICILLVACASLEPPVSGSSGLTFVHLNDTYRVGAVEDGNAGGFGRAVTVIRSLQAEGRDVHILHGGDFLNPSLESQLWNGMQMVEALNFMDALAPMHLVMGNHEIDRRTPEHLINAVKASQFDWLGDNYQFETGDVEVDEALKDAFTISFGQKTIGIFSLTTHVDDGGNDRSYVPIDKDYLGTAEKVIEHFERIGVDAIIGLTHLHMSTDLEIARLRAKHPRFVFVVGGHDHEPEYSPLSDSSAAVMKGASNARVIWTIDLDFDEAGMPDIATEKLNLDASVDLDPDYQAIDDKWRTRLLERFPFLEARVGMAALSMDAREIAIRSVESSWANFVADQMRVAFGKPVADFAFINGGTLRIDDMINGDILFEDIGRTFGFSSFLRHTTVTGAEFQKVMEAGYRGTGGTQGYFPHVSGFRICVDRSRNEKDRIVSLQVPAESGWTEIEADKIYSLVVPDFLYGGGDGYQIPKDRPASRPASELKYLVLDAILAAQAKGQKVGVVVDHSNRRYHELREGKERCFQ
jgi:5'-nucleotidase / UDP-sugar diphosphatase